MNVARLRRHLPALGLILLAAFALRLAWMLAVHPDPVAGWYGGDETVRRFDDTVWYRGAAHYLLRGEGYLNPFTGTPTAAWPPGYPAFLAAIFKLFGEGATQTYAANIALALITIVIVYAIAQQLFERRTAIVAAALIAVWPGQIYFTSLTLSEPLFTALLTLGVLLTLLVPRARRARGAVVLLLGVVMGAAVLTRGQAALLLPLALAYWRFEGLRWQAVLGWGILAAFVAGVMLAPWVARNQRELGSPVIIATNLGPNLWIGHHEGATGRMTTNLPEPPQPSRAGRTQGEFEVAADRLALRKGLSYMLTHPADEVRLSATKIRAMYESDATALDWNSGYTDGYYASEGVEHALRRLANGFWFAALAFAAAGLLASRQRLRGPAGYLGLFVVCWTLTHLLFFGDSRFHYPIVFAIAIFGARGLVLAYETLRRPDARLAGRYAEA